MEKSKLPFNEEKHGWVKSNSYSSLEFVRSGGVHVGHQSKIKNLCKTQLGNYKYRGRHENIQSIPTSNNWI